MKIEKPDVHAIVDDWVEYVRSLAEEFFPGQVGEPFEDREDFRDEARCFVIPIIIDKPTIEFCKTDNRLMDRFIAEVPAGIRDQLFIEIQVKEYNGIG